MVAAGSKCRTCRGPAIIDLPRHNANVCAEHFMELCRRQVVKAIVDVARNFGIKTIAEGVESQVTLELLRDRSG